MIKEIAHVGLYTDKFEETIDFYKRALDAEELGVFCTDKRGCWLQIGESILEIFESIPMPSEGSFKHVAFFCDSVEQSYEKAIANGAVSHMEPKNICLELKEKQEMRIAFVKGVNGEQIEFCEKI